MYQVEKLPLDQVQYYDQIVLDYLDGRSELTDFYNYPPQFEQLEEAIKEVRNFFDEEKRGRLSQVLQEQYKDVETASPIQENIKALGQSGTFTITTGHQPAIFTGPLYFIYKIVSAINVAEKLNQKYEEYTFVPVYWLGGEDHDFDEVNSMTLFGKTLQWEQEGGGPVGRMETDSLKELLPRLKDILGDNERANSIYQRLENAYGGQPNLAAATRCFLNDLFGEDGLVVLDPDQKELKQLFTPVLKDDIQNQTAHSLVQRTVEDLKQVYQQNSYEPQANPRPINVFYMKDEFRVRLEQQNGQIQTVEQEQNFSNDDLQQELKNNPQRFSPNVILRPVYQQTILPNLAYIGGGAEVSYWLELKAVFDHYEVPYPMVLLRDSALWLDGVSAKRVRKLGIDYPALFQQADKIINQYITNQMEDENPLKEERQEMRELFDRITEKAKSTDGSLKGYVKARQKRVEKMLGNIHNRIRKAEKDNQEIAVNQIEKTKEKLFPDNNLQERVENLLPLYLQYGEEWFDILKKEFDPFEKRFKVFAPSD